MPQQSARLPGRQTSAKGGRPEPTPETSRKVIVWMILTITLVILVTEISEIYFHSPEPIEGIIHILALSGVMAPLFYFFWFRPLTRQISLAQAFQAQIRKLNHRLLEASEQERLKIAQDLHDEFGQKLTSLQLQLEALEQTLAKGQLPPPECCKPLMVTVNDLTMDLRNVLADLRPATLDWLGLPAALEALCNDINDQENTPHIEFRSAGIKDPLHPDVGIALYRAAQEALTNILRHARANRVEVCLTRCHPSIILTIQDDGIGIKPQEVDQKQGRFSAHYGLIGMRERVAAVGGDFRIASCKEGGTRIRIEVPDALLRTADSAIDLVDGRIQ